MTIDEYQKLCEETNQNSQSGIAQIEFPFLGLFGEVGTLLSALKKKQRDGRSFVDYNSVVIEEFGDSLWYLATVATKADLRLSGLAVNQFQPLKKKSLNPKLTFKALQPDVSDPHTKSVAFENALIVLGAKTGLLLNSLPHKHPSDPHSLAQPLSEVFSALVAAADRAGIDLQIAAQRNINKTHARWPVDRVRTPLFGSQFPVGERFPDVIKMEIFEYARNGKKYVIQRCNDINIGSQLTDNSLNDDGYRFHDVFHLAYAAILGWSPVMRALFKLKRKSNVKEDEVQDGARAAFMEEGLSALVFQRARTLNNFKNIKVLDYSLLKLIQDLVAGYEVEKCSPWEWEEAILEGFSVFRKLKSNSGGIVIANIKDRTIGFKKMKKR